MAISEDTTHPLNYALELLPSGCRYRTLKATKSIYKLTIAPDAISLLNFTVFLGGVNVLIMYLFDVLCELYW